MTNLLILIYFLNNLANFSVTFDLKKTTLKKYPLFEFSSHQLTFMAITNPFTAWLGIWSTFIPSIQDMFNAN